MDPSCFVTVQGWCFNDVGYIFMAHCGPLSASWVHLLMAPSWMRSKQICNNCVMLTCQHAPKSLGSFSTTLLKLRYKELVQFWRQKGPTWYYQEVPNKVASKSVSPSLPIPPWFASEQEKMDMTKVYIVSNMQLLLSRCCWKVDNKCKTSSICHDFRATGNKVEEMKWCPGIMPPFSKFLKAPKLPVSTWLTPKVSSFLLPLSSLPLEWNGDRGLVKTESVDSLYPVICTSAGFTEAKKEYKLNIACHYSLSFSLSECKASRKSSLCFIMTHHCSPFEQCSNRLLNLVISTALSAEWPLWIWMSKKEKFNPTRGLRTTHSRVPRDGVCYLMVRVVNRFKRTGPQVSHRYTTMSESYREPQTSVGSLLFLYFN